MVEIDGGLVEGGGGIKNEEDEAKNLFFTKKKPFTRSKSVHTHNVPSQQKL